MIIMKFGGTSIRNAAAMQHVARIVTERIPSRPVVVLSAVAGVTDLLEESLNLTSRQKKAAYLKCISKITGIHTQLADELFSEEEVRKRVSRQLQIIFGRLTTLLEASFTIRTENENLTHAVLATGERLSTTIFNALLQQNGIKSGLIDAAKYMITTSPESGIRPLPEQIAKRARRHIDPLFKNHRIIVTQGFIGATTAGVPTTLGRNGSDFSAALLGAALNCEEIQIWTDVDGILTADPSIIAQARPLTEMTFEEACELAYFGARVLHPAAIQPALEKNIPVLVLNSQRPDQQGTTIVNQNGRESHQGIRSIAYKENITLLSLQTSRLLFSPAILDDIFRRLAQHDKHVYAVQKSATRLSLTVEKHDDLAAIFDDLPYISEYNYTGEKAIVSVVGEEIRSNPLISGEILRMLTEAGIRPDLISQDATQISLLFIIEQKDINKTVELLHSEYIEPAWITQTGEV